MRAALFLSVALIALPAHAQVNDQYQGGDATAVTTIDVGEAHDAAATAVASGNVVGVTADDADAFMLNDQHMDGDTSATANATVDEAHDNVAMSSVAVANGATAVLNDSNVTVDSLQLAHGDTDAATTFNGGGAQNAATSASAAGNVAAVSLEFSNAELLIAQENTSSSSATIEASHGDVADQVVAGAVANANSLSVGSYTTTLLSRTRQHATGESVAASVDLYADHATDVSGNATANANSITVDNQWGFLETRVIQEASTDVAARSEVTLGDHFHGFASSGAYGVGNQMMASNVGSDMWMNTVQDNSGDISADASLAGAGGDMALASAAAYGNNVTGSLCGYCDVNAPSLVTTNNQTNSGDVSASARVNTPYARTAAASATAIGNAATYQVAGPDGD